MYWGPCYHPSTYGVLVWCNASLTITSLTVRFIVFTASYRGILAFPHMLHIYVTGRLRQLR